MYKYTLSILSALGILFLITCGNNIQNPFTQDKAKVFLHLESSTKATSDTAITDTTGNTIRIGVSYFMPSYFDSVVITVEKTIQSVDTFFVCGKTDIKDDTAWFEYAFKSEGIRTVTATGYVAGGYKPSAIATITAIARPVVLVNHKPALIVTGRKSIITTEACTLSVSANDTDTAQVHTFQVTKGPTGYVFTNHIFTWKPTPADTGTDSVTFTVADNGTPVMSDTQTVTIIISPPVLPLNHKPILVITGRTTITTAEICTLTISVTDPDSGQTHSMTILTAPQGYAFKDSVFTWMPPAGFLGSDTTRKDSVTFTTTDNGTPPLRDTAKAVIIVKKNIPKKFTLTLAIAGSGTTTPSSSALVDSSADTAVTASANPGNSFVNWTTNGSNAIIATPTSAATRITLNGNATVTANFKADSFKITFDPNQGSGTMAQQTILSGATVNLSPNAFMRTGYTFTGWSTIQDGTISYYDGSSYTMGKSNVVLYAKWTIKTYVLTIAKTGNGTTNPAPGTVDVDTGVAATITAKPGIGYSFVNWSVTGPALVKSLTSDSTTVKLSGDASVTANFTINTYTLSIISGGNGTATGGGDGNYGTIKNISATPASGYQFLNWTVTSGNVSIGSITSASTTATLSNSNATVQANFTPIIDTVKFNCNGGTAVANLAIQYGRTIGTAPATTMTGFVVDGWYTEAAFTNKYGFSTPVTANITLYAKWVVRDVNGNIYDTVKIGNQIWMKQNFAATKYNDSSAISLVTDSATWANRTTEGYCYYNNTTNADSIKKFGPLYNWYAVNTGKLAPAGWHVPSQAEWDTLQDYLIAHGFNWDNTTTGNKIAKAMAAQTDWMPSSTASGIVGNNLALNNKCGFTGLPAGLRDYGGGFSYVGIIGNWWSTTNAGYPNGSYYCYLFNTYDYLYRNDWFNNSGFSVRLLRD